MYVHAKMREFDERLKALFDVVDQELELMWGDLHALHPNRPASGVTDDPSSDGLFEIAADFTPGYGSEYGRGYIIAFRVATLERVKQADFERLMSIAATLIERYLPEFFPDRRIDVVRDGARFKLIGDFSLGKM